MQELTSFTEDLSQKRSGALLEQMDDEF